MASSVTRTNIAVHSRSPVIVANYTFSCTRASSTSHEVTVTFSGTMRCQDSSSYYQPGSGYGLGFYVTSDDAGDRSNVSTRYGNLRTGGSSTSFNVSWTIEADSYDTIRISSDCMFNASGCGQNAEVSNFDEITAPAYNPTPSSAAPTVRLSLDSRDPGDTASVNENRYIKFLITSNDGSDSSYELTVNGIYATSGTFSASSSSYKSFTIVNPGSNYDVEAGGYGYYVQLTATSTRSGLSGSDYMVLSSSSGGGGGSSNPTISLSSNKDVSFKDENVRISYSGESDEGNDLLCILYINDEEVVNREYSSGFSKSKTFMPENYGIDYGESYTVRLEVYDAEDSDYYSVESITLETYGEQEVTISSSSQSITGHVGDEFSITVDTVPINWNNSRDGNINVYYEVYFDSFEYNILGSNVSGTRSWSYTTTFVPEEVGVYQIYGFVRAVDDETDTRWWESDSCITLIISEEAVQPTFDHELNGLSGKGSFSINDADTKYQWFANNASSSTYCKVYLRIYADSSPYSPYEREIPLNDGNAYAGYYYDSRYKEMGFRLYLTSGNGGEGETFLIENMLSDDEKSRGLVWFSIYAELYDPNWGSGRLDIIQLNALSEPTELICDAVVYTPYVRSLTDSQLRLNYFPLQNKVFQLDSSIEPSAMRNGNKFAFMLMYTEDSRASGFIDGFDIKIYDKPYNSSDITEDNYITYKRIYVRDMGAYYIHTSVASSYTIWLDAKDDLQYRCKIGSAVIRPFYEGPNAVALSPDTLDINLVIPFTQFPKPIIYLPNGIGQLFDGIDYGCGYWHNNKFRILMRLPQDLDYSYYKSSQSSTYKYGDVEVSINDEIYAYFGRYLGRTAHKEIFSSNIDKGSTNNHTKNICINPSLISGFPDVSSYTIKVRVQKYPYFFSDEDMADASIATWSDWSEPITIMNTPITPVNVQSGDFIMHSHYDNVYNKCADAYWCYNIADVDLGEKNRYDIIEGSKKVPGQLDKGEYLGMYNVIKTIINGVNNYCVYDRPAVKFPELPEFNPENEKITADLDTTVSGNGNNYMNLILKYINDYLQ